MGNNLTVFADAKINGGEYEKIKVFGSADILGDITAQKVSIFGSSHFSGKCQIDTMKLYGSSDFEEYVELKELDIKGSCKFNADIKVDMLKIYGSVQFKKKLYRCKEVKLYGEATVSNLESDEIYIHGHVTCTETLNGEKIEITTNKGSEINEMVGTHITVKPGRKFFLKDSSQRIRISTIEGDDIYLENVISNVVRGNKISVGPNCQIDHIEYHEECQVSGKSKVGNKEMY